MNSKKPFEHIEDKIKQAAENYQPPFDEKAWQAMEAKLDGDNKKRRPLLWWWLLPLMLVAGYGVYTLNNKTHHAATDTSSSKSNSTTAKNTAAPVPADNTINQPVEKPVTNNIDAGDNKAAGKADKTNTTPANKNNRNSNTVTANRNNVVTIAQPVNTTNPGSFSKDNSLTRKGKIAYSKKGKLKSSASGGEAGDISSTEVNDDGNEKSNINTNNTPAPPIKQVTGKEVAAIADEKPVAVKQEEIKKDTDSANNKTAETTENKKKEKQLDKPKEKNQKGFYAQLVGGTDAGSVHLFSYDKSRITGKFGIGLGYRFGNRISVQTGFYVTSKRYDASGSDYNVKAGSPMSTYSISWLKATCRVYEIPLAIKYDIISKPSFIFFGTAGVSSYIMQKENYDCYYRYANNTYEREWDFKGNKHLFSTAVFSFGIEKKLNNNLFFLAEPSFSVPLRGVGDGKMKIYSSSLQAGAKYYFNRK